MSQNSHLGFKIKSWKATIRLYKFSNLDNYYDKIFDAVKPEYFEKFLRGFLDSVLNEAITYDLELSTEI
jgi:hypothetical protein